MADLLDPLADHNAGMATARRMLRGDRAGFIALLQTRVRTAPGAEEELRIVFDTIAQIMQAEAPGLFQDFAKDGEGSWVPEYRKV